MFSDQHSIMSFKRICQIGSSQASSLNCSKRSLLIGRFEITKCTGWIRLFSLNSDFTFSMYAQLTASKNSIVVLGEYFKSNLPFRKCGKNFWIRDRKLTMDVQRLVLMAGDHWLQWIYVHKDIHGISQHQNLWKVLSFWFDRSVFRNIKVIMVHIQHGTILGRLRFCRCFLEGHLILESLHQFSNGSVD